ncbi:dynein axonemal assembly factor 3 [Musca autumnalis]|uniref:dynein axonemal assembly factor 3 n=1 Tax=Musca autumnalis TaxID=221902 RepID=UPI003CF0DDF4
MFWGLSEALDLIEEYLRITGDCCENADISKNDDKGSGKKERNNEEHINILLFGSNDPRHVIKTIAKLYTHREKGFNSVINFYIIDGCVEIVARNMLLLGIALENPETINVRSKAHLFMDVYGNSLLRPFSHQYLMAKTKSLLKMITDSEYLQKLAPFISIEGLKYRERDGLLNALNFWMPKSENIFNIKQYWSDRVRKLLGTRYDYREGQFDWDLNMVLKDRGASQICSQEYRHWRETGIAFTFPEFEYHLPNKTLSAGLVRNGEQYFHRGYVGDIQTGPFVNFGLTTSDKRMLKSAHGENDYRSTDITERNILELFHELTSQTPYEHDLTHSHKYGSVRLQMSKILTSTNNDVMVTLSDYEHPWIRANGVQINFLSTECVFTMQNNNSRWTEFFDIIFVSHNYFSFLKESFVSIMRSPSILIFEGKLLCTERKDVVDNFDEKLLSFGKGNNLKSVINYDAINAKRSHFKFKKIN